MMSDEVIRPRSRWFTRDIAQAPLAHTYSIVARDADTGQLGVAVQSHCFAVGSIVIWAEAEVGAVATQSVSEPAYGALGLDLMRADVAAPDTLNGLLATDHLRELRQVAMVDAQGRVAAHTGQLAIPEAGHLVGEGFSVQANIMERSPVWPAMAVAYRNARGELAERLLLALEAAEVEGGDLRGSQSAAILVVNGTSTGRRWIDRLFDLRVDDHSEPLRELRRLVGIKRASTHRVAGDAAFVAGDAELGSREYTQAEQLSANPELRFWHAVGLINAMRADAGLAKLKELADRDRRWIEYALRLTQRGALPADDLLRARIRDLTK